jgi:D-glycero-D-manno-heptose 1,7-bisphosphate phosphatase
MKLLVLGRDGVINGLDGREWQPLAGSVDACARATQAGARCIVLCDEPTMRHGRVTVETVNRLHAQMLEAIRRQGGRVEAVFYCPHYAEDNCGCGGASGQLLEQIVARARVPVEEITVITDSLPDLNAARRLGARAVLVETGRGRDTLEAEPDLRDALVYSDLAQAVDALCQAQFDP